MRDPVVDEPAVASPNDGSGLWPAGVGDRSTELSTAAESTPVDGETVGPSPRPRVSSRPLPTAAVLMQEYVRNGRSLRSVAEDYGLSVGELRELIVGYGLPLHQGVIERPVGTAALTADYLQREYVVGGRTAGEIAAEVGVSEQSVLRYLHRAGISVRRGGGSALGEHLTRELLEREYVELERTA